MLPFMPLHRNAYTYAQVCEVKSYSQKLQAVPFEFEVDTRVMQSVQ